MSLSGRWRMVETELWDSDALNLVAPALIEFGEEGLGSFGFIAVQGGIPGSRRCAGASLPSRSAGPGTGCRTRTPERSPVPRPERQTAVMAVTDE